jgi:opacity protein-like surface antigen
MRRLLLILSAAALVSAPLAGQAVPPVTAADYARAERFLAANLTGLVSGGSVAANWLPDDRFWYRRSLDDGAEFVLVDPARGTRGPAFDHDRVAAALSQATGSTADGRHLPFEAIEFAADGRTIGVNVGAARWSCAVDDLQSGALKNKITTGDGPVMQIARVDAKSRTVWFGANGREPGQDPYFLHFYRVGLDGRGLVSLTPDDGTHARHLTRSRLRRQRMPALAEAEEQRQSIAEARWPSLEIPVRRLDEGGPRNTAFAGEPGHPSAERRFPGTWCSRHIQRLSGEPIQQQCRPLALAPAHVDITDWLPLAALPGGPLGPRRGRQRHVDALEPGGAAVLRLQAEQIDAGATGLQPGQVLRRDDRLGRVAVRALSLLGRSATAVVSSGRCSTCRRCISIVSKSPFSLPRVPAKVPTMPRVSSSFRNLTTLTQSRAASSVGGS